LIYPARSTDSSCKTTVVGV